MSELRLRLNIQRQPDDSTCGPTSLLAVYNYYGDEITLDEVVATVPYLETGGTLAVLLACHALKRGYAATIYTYNVQVFDPTWFRPGANLRERLEAQMLAKQEPRITIDTHAYLEFLELGGEVRFEDLSLSLLNGYLSRGVPVLTGLSATYLYREMREYGVENIQDDIRGYPSGHFVVLCGYDPVDNTILIADPLHPTDSENGYYSRNIDTVLNAIMLGILTYDANLLIIEPRAGEP